MKYHNIGALLFISRCNSFHLGMEIWWLYIMYSIIVLSDSHELNLPVLTSSKYVYVILGGFVLEKVKMSVISYILFGAW